MTRTAIASSVRRTTPGENSTDNGTRRASTAGAGRTGGSTPPPASCSIALQHAFRFVVAPDSFKPARRFRQLAAQPPDPQSADTANDEHCAPAKPRDHREFRSAKQRTRRNWRSD